MFKETQPNHAISSIIASTKLPLCCVNLKEQKNYNKN